MDLLIVTDTSTHRLVIAVSREEREKLKPIFHCDAKPFALGPRVGLDPQLEIFIVSVIECLYTGFQHRSYTVLESLIFIFSFVRPYKVLFLGIFYQKGLIKSYFCLKRKKKDISELTNKTHA